MLGTDAVELVLQLEAGGLGLALEVDLRLLLLLGEIGPTRRRAPGRGRCGPARARARAARRSSISASMAARASAVSRSRSSGARRSRRRGRCAPARSPWRDRRGRGRARSRPRRGSARSPGRGGGRGPRLVRLGVRRDEDRRGLLLGGGEGGGGLALGARAELGRPRWRRPGSLRRRARPPGELLGRLVRAGDHVVDLARAFFEHAVRLRTRLGEGALGEPRARRPHECARPRRPGAASRRRCRPARSGGWTAPLRRATCSRASCPGRRTSGCRPSSSSAVSSSMRARSLLDCSASWLFALMMSRRSPHVLLSTSSLSYPRNTCVNSVSSTAILPPGSVPRSWGLVGCADCTGPRHPSRTTAHRGGRPLRRGRSATTRAPVIHSGGDSQTAPVVWNVLVRRRTMRHRRFRSCASPSPSWHSSPRP